MARQVRRHAPAPALLTLGLLAAVLVGCGGSPAEPESPFPARPVDIDVSTLDPCDALDPSRAEALGLGEGARGTAVVDGTEARDCTWLGNGDASNYGVQVISLGAVTAAAEPSSRIVTVGGYGAVEGAPQTNNGPGLPAFCQLAIDVNDNQTIRVQVNNGRPSTGGDPNAIRDVCRQAGEVAAEVLTVLTS